MTPPDAGVQLHRALDLPGHAVRWGACLRAVPSGDVIASVGAVDVLPLASVGKLLLLVAVAEAIESGAVVGGLAAGRAVDRAVSGRVMRWLAVNTDLSMVAGAFGLDPLAHLAADRGVVVRNKTGTDVGVRADVGVVTGPARSVAYAVLARFDGGSGARDGGDDRDGVLAAMAEVGRLVGRLVSGAA